MKALLSIFYFVLFLNSATAQIFQIGATHYIRRFDYSYLDKTAGQGFLLSMYKADERNSQSMEADILIAKGFYLNTGFIWQRTFCGFLAQHPDGAAAGELLGSLWHYQVPIRLKYQYKIYTKWNRSLWVSATAGIAVNINKGYNDPWQNGTEPWKTLPASNTRALYYTYTYNSSLHKTFLLYRGDLEAGVDIMPWAAFFFRIGAAVGTEKQVVHNVEYMFQGEPLMQGTVYGKGNTWFYGIGIYGKFFPKKTTWKDVFRKKQREKISIGN